jgi:NAD(P)-dependent dehydrogenase (short-subunit alcohol dehydrogenase family)
MILKDKVVVVTGASEGIGRAIVVRLAKEGAKLALVARGEDKLKEVSGGVDGEAFVCDIRDRAQVQQTVDAIVAKLGGIDVLINNAGIWQRESQLDELSDEMVGDVLATNLTGTIFMTKYVLPYLRSNNQETAILQIVSKSGITAQEGQSIYTASKWGVKGFTDVLRVDLKGTKIRVGAVYQSGTDTDMFRKAGDNFDQAKLTEPADLADAVAYMLTRPPKMWLPEIQVVY